jgi:hypothetical protein
VKKLGFALLLGTLFLGSQLLARAESAGTTLTAAPLSSAQVADILGLSLRT